MAQLVLLRGARQLLTLRGSAEPRRGPALLDLGVIRDGAVLIREGRIDAVGPTRRIENLAAARHAREINAMGHIVVPGLVDSETQLPIGAPSLATSRLEVVTRTAAARMLRHGATTIAACPSAGSDPGTRKMLRVLRKVEEGPWDLVPITPGAAAGALARIRRRKLARLVEGDRQALQAARALGFGLKVRADVSLAIEMEALCIAGLTSPAAAAALAQSAVVATLTPLDGALARPLIDHGAAIALATGFGMSGAPTCSLQAIVSLACKEWGLTPEEAISAVTINAAHAVGLAARLGSIEPGKQADLLLLNCTDYREIPYHFGVNHVHLAMKLGMVVYREGSAGSWPKAS